jgi:transcription antitermination factor NusG
MLTEGPGWCVVMSNPMGEELAERGIREAGYRVYLPRERKMLRGDGTRKRPRSEIVMRPLFRGYLFAELHPNQQWHPIRDARGVSRSALIMRGERPALLPPALVEAIRIKEQAGDFDDPRIAAKNRPTRKAFNDGKLAFKKGEIVRIETGPFESHLAQLVDLDQQGRAILLHDLLGVLRDVPLDSLAAVG